MYSFSWFTPPQMLPGSINQDSIKCSCHAAVRTLHVSRAERRGLLLPVAAGRGFGEARRTADKKEGKGNKEQERRSKQDGQKRQVLSLEERFLAKTKGGSDPHAAFEDRLEEMKRKAQIAVKERSDEGQQSAEDASILDATPRLSSPVSASSITSNSQSQETAQVGPTQVALGGGALLLAAIFVVTSFGDFGQPAKQVSAPANMESKLGEEERRDLLKQTTAFEADTQRASASAEILRQAAASYSALGEGQKASAALEKLTEVAPQDSEAWQLLAEARVKLGDAQGAVAAYKRAVGEAILPDLPLLQGLADALTADARQQEAVDILSAQQPESGAGIDVIDLQLLIGKVYTQWPRHDAQALAVYDGLISQHPDDFRGYAAKGVLLRRQGRKGDAQRLFVQARYYAPPGLRSLVDQIIAP